MFGLPENLPDRQPPGLLPFPPPMIRTYWRLITKSSPLMIAMLLALAPGITHGEDIRTFLVTWSGESFDNNATANAQLTVDMDLIANPGMNRYDKGTGGFVKNFSITVEGYCILERNVAEG